MSERATDSKQAFWDAAYLVALGALMSGHKDTGGIVELIRAAERLADRSLEVRSRGIAARSPEVEPAKPAKVKRAPVLLLSRCQGSGSPLPERGDVPCPKCKRIVGAQKGRGGWYLASHKLPAEVR